MRSADQDQVQQWDELMSRAAADPLQGAAFANLKQLSGWSPQYMIHQLKDRELPTLYLRRSVWGLGQVWYSPKGPSIQTSAELEVVIADWRQHQPRPLLVKIEPNLSDSDEHRHCLRQLGLTKTRDLQPNRATVRVGLSLTEDALLTSFKPKTRYNIRLAQKRGVAVEVVPTTPENMDLMYGLLQQAQSRGGFWLRPKSYYRQLWQTVGGNGRLFLARYEGQVVAGAYIWRLGTKALYKDGGSRREHKAVQAPYLLQWEIMRWLKSAGVTEYDLHGVPPLESGPDHPLASLAQFKSGFGPTTQTVGTWDLPLSPAYALWQKAGERLAMTYAYRLKGQTFY